MTTLPSRLADLHDRLPYWARPALWGAVFVGSAAFGRVMILAPTGGLRAWALGVVAIVISGLGGGVAGLAWSTLRPLRRRGTAGLLINWLLVVTVYLLTVGATLKAFDSASFVLDRPTIYIALVLGFAYAVALTHWIGNPSAAADNALEIAPGIVREAIRADLLELRERARGNPESLDAIRQIEDEEIGPAYVAHWYRVVARIGRHGSSVTVEAAMAQAEGRLRQVEQQWLSFQPRAADR